MSFFKFKNIKIYSGIKVLLVTYSFVIIFVNINHVALTGRYQGPNESSFKTDSFAETIQIWPF